MEEIERIKLARTEKERYQMQGPISVILGIFVLLGGVAMHFQQPKNTFNESIGLGLGIVLI